jgi:hypothetical protein
VLLTAGIATRYLSGLSRTGEYYTTRRIENPRTLP